jgi:hypothetical protein
MNPNTRIAAINLVGGDREPFYAATLRAFYFDTGAKTGQVVDDVAGVRVLLADAEPRRVENDGKHPVYQPLLLRAYVRPQRHDGEERNHGLELTLSGDGKQFTGTLVGARPVHDVTLVPHNEWPHKLGDDIDVPPMRFIAGAVPVALESSGDLVGFLRLVTKNKKSTLFAGFELATPAAKTLAVRLVPGGIEFEGSVPDPTRDLPGGDPMGRIKGVFRLEGRHDAKKHQTQYWLRLVDGDRKEMDKLESRIARAFADLAAESNAPLLVRFDRRPAVPPLIWPMTIAAGTLALNPVPKVKGEFEMAIDPSAIDVRLRTVSEYPGDLPGLAVIHGEHLLWKKQASGFDLTISAGAGKAAIEIKFARMQVDSATTWGATLTSQLNQQDVELPLASMSDRLLGLYQSGRVVAPEVTQAPYAFLPTAHGWLQLDLRTPTKRVFTSPAGTTAMTGRIVGDHGKDSMRGIVIDEAASLSLTLAWRLQDGAYRASEGTLAIGGARGRLRGFVFAAETAPTAAEALPDLRRGPAATADLPLSFNSSQLGATLLGKFSWQDNAWTLEVNDLVDYYVPRDNDPLPAAAAGAAPKGLKGYVWKAPHAKPFVTNHPLTRSAVTPAEPSASRGLLRYAFAGRFTLKQAVVGDAPALSVEKPPKAWDFQEPPPKTPEFVKDTLVLTTLPGAEFTPGQPETSVGFYAALRHDLPILDELFAWSDPPPAPSAPAPASDDDGVIVTAVDPGGLKKVWHQNRLRMALTRTEDAFMTEWVQVGQDHKQTVESLVQPYRWTDVPFKVDLAKPWGEYHLAGEDYRLDTALAGLKKDFDVDPAGELKAGTAIVVRGNAASLFEDAGLLWDSRGTGLGPSAMEGSRAFALRTRAAGALKTEHGTLRTLLDAMVIDLTGAPEWMKAARLAFFFRDLPVEDGTFDGEANPVEGAPGTVGQAFKREHFPKSLHEWRLFQAPAKEADVDAPKPFDIQFGPFLFTPLRLRRVQWDGGGAISVIQVVGGLRLGYRAVETPHAVVGAPPAVSKAADEKPREQPFGVDHAYLAADLFCLTLTRNGGAWTPTWNGVELGTAPTLFGNREPVVTTALRLDVHQAGIQSEDNAPVEATVAVDIVSNETTLGARLFGRQCLLETTATVYDDGITLHYTSGIKAGRRALALLALDGIDVVLSLQEQSIRVNGSLLLMPTETDEADDASALARFSQDAATFRWLDLAGGTPDKESAPPLRIDHRSGRVSARWEGRWDQVTPLFGLTASEWAVRACLEASLADPEPMKALAPLGLAVAWARIAGVAGKTSHRIDHRLLVDRTTSEHGLDVSWEQAFESPIGWPVGGIHRDDGGELPSPADQLEAGDSTKSGRSQGIQIAVGEALRHSVTLRLKRHRIEANALVRTSDRIRPLTAIHLLAEVGHELSGGGRTVRFTTLDYVAITSLRLMVKTSGGDTFAARYKTLNYRGLATESKVPHEGVVELPWAVSGFFDEALIRHYRTFKDTPQFDQVLFLGGAAVLLPHHVDGVEKSVAGVIPWAALHPAFPSPPKTPFLTQAGGRWRVASPDLWAGYAYPGSFAPRTIVVAAGSDAAQLKARLDTAGLALTGSTKKALARVLPLEQAFFESLAPKDPIDISKAPFFLRALLAIEARWRQHPQNDTWRALSLLPRRGGVGNSPTPIVAVELKLQEVRQAEQTKPIAPDVAGIQADLIALSSRRIARHAAYRLVQAETADDLADRNPRAELIERARDLDRFAECAIREVNREGQVPGIVVVAVPSVRILEANDTGIGVKHTMLPASPALGWPTMEGMADIGLLAPQLGAELPVQSSVAGFAARFQQLGLPGWARKGDQVDTYLSLSRRVAFMRDTDVPFNGPPARHLSTVNSRLRAPLDKTLDVEKSEGRSPTDLPFFELATLGRRPGVFEVVTASVTRVAENDPFDPDHARFGRPANSGPVAAHQLRTPRSPSLPGDQADVDAAAEDDSRARLGRRLGDVLKLRRRTFVSLADREKPEPNQVAGLKTFISFPGSVAVLRHEYREPSEVQTTHVRVAMWLAWEDKPLAIIGPSWNGWLSLTVKAVAGTAAGPLDVVPPAALAAALEAPTARLEVDALAFPMSVSQPSSAADQVVSLTVQSLPTAQDALRRATVDSRIRLVVTFGPTPVNRAMSVAPRHTVTIPLSLDPGNRRVLETRTCTIAFGDPSYDRQLGSTTEGDITQVDSARVLLSVDRRDYDTGATLYFACGALDAATGVFDKNGTRKYTVRFRRIASPNPDGSLRPPDLLMVANSEESQAGKYELTDGTAYELPLSQLRYLDSPDSAPCPLAPGDRLEIRADVGAERSKPLTVFVNIVARPIIAPPPCVYSVIESTNEASRVVLHAAAPLPQQIELPQLLEGLALGYVNRRALFLWRFVATADEKATIDLVKFDRSGGAQLPVL